ncbi:branched-chain amino acid transaminase [Thermodesulfovibrio thiophilus]|uniref:branched-chain amino acid transaminase n=1 Tax=Thermodesulfovibrio thiophilus TaxID=340095 RepID=UPI0017CE9EE3|nr:branched-chain amino acid transaminase [Thermodesulfovibrio thiophilus]
MIPKTEKIWMDGKFVNWDDAKIHVLTHSLHYGLALFEGIRCYETEEGPAVFRLKEHVERLFKSAHIFTLKIPFTETEIYDAIKETIRINKINSCYIRPIVFIGYGSMGVYPKNNPIQVAIAAWSWGAYLGKDAIQNGIKVKTSSFIRNHVNSSMSRGKVAGYYVNGQLAKIEAVSCGFDEAILLDTEGYVSEGSGENIFMVRKGILKTTPLTSILEGVTRDTVINIAKDLGIEVREERFTRDELYISDEVFFTGTAAEITPIREIDGRVIGSGSCGSVTRKIQNLFFDIVKGKSPKYKHWLDFV